MARYYAAVIIKYDSAHGEVESPFLSRTQKFNSESIDTKKVKIFQVLTNLELNRRTISLNPSGMERSLERKT